MQLGSALLPVAIAQLIANLELAGLMKGSASIDLQDLVQLNINRIQQLTELEAQHSKDGAPSVPDSRKRKAARELIEMPVSRILPSQPLDTSGSWVPVAFVEIITARGMITFQHAGQPWILFRDKSGNAACIEDCCAHRACPLSLVRPSLHTITCLTHRRPSLTCMV